jgi:hypothetical protein
MALFNLASNKGAEKEEAQNGTIDGIAIPTPDGLIKVFAKSR